MHPLVRNIAAIVAGIILGSCVNMGIIVISGSIIPPPKGADISTMEGLKTSMHLFKPIHFLMPFLAHALGTLVGAWTAAKVVLSHQIKFAFGIGIVFLIVGIVNVFMLPSPLWFTLLDLILAYIPMAYLGWRIAERKN